MEDIRSQPGKMDRLRIKTPSAFVKRPMRKRKDGGIVIFVGVRSGGSLHRIWKAKHEPTQGLKEPQ
jgi:hypothetical protein